VSGGGDDSVKSTTLDALVVLWERGASRRGEARYSKSCSMKSSNGSGDSESATSYSDLRLEV